MSRCSDVLISGPNAQSHLKDSGTVMDLADARGKRESFTWDRMPSRCLLANLKPVQYRFLQIYSYKNPQQTRTCHHNVTICPEQDTVRSTSRHFVFSVMGHIQLDPGRNERLSLRIPSVSHQNCPGHHALSAPPTRPQLQWPVALLEKHLDPHHRVPLAARHRLGQPQQRHLRGLVRHVHDDASIRAEEGRGEEQRVRDMLYRRRRHRRRRCRHSGDDDARRRSLHGHHVERVGQLDVSVRDRVGEFFRAPPSPVEQVDPTCAESVKRVDRRARSASCADDETAIDLVQGRRQASFDNVANPYCRRQVDPDDHPHS